MNTVVEYEAQCLDAMLDEDPLAVRMILDNLQVPLDVQDRILLEVASLGRRNRHKIAQIIEHHGLSTLPDELHR